MSLNDNIIQASAIVAQNQIDKAGLDKTIEATVIRCQDSIKGIYRVKYQDGQWKAYSNNLNVTYANGANVYVLIPRGDMSNTKTILGTVKQLGLDYINILKEDQKYQENGFEVNLGNFGLCSYHPERRVIYQDGKTTNSGNTDENFNLSFENKTGFIETLSGGNPQGQKIKICKDDLKQYELKRFIEDAVVENNYSLAEMQNNNTQVQVDNVKNFINLTKGINMKGRINIKILGIGNSFTRDSFKWIASILHAAYPDLQQIEVYHGYIGGISLTDQFNRLLLSITKPQWKSLFGTDNDYDKAREIIKAAVDVQTLKDATKPEKYQMWSYTYKKNINKVTYPIFNIYQEKSLAEILSYQKKNTYNQSKPWDLVFLQQQSDRSGVEKNYTYTFPEGLTSIEGQEEINLIKIFIKAVKILSNYDLNTHLPAGMLITWTHNENNRTTGFITNYGGNIKTQLDATKQTILNVVNKVNEDEKLIDFVVNGGDVFWELSNSGKFKTLNNGYGFLRKDANHLYPGLAQFISSLNYVYAFTQDETVIDKVFDSNYWSTIQYKNRSGVDTDEQTKKETDLSSMVISKFFLELTDDELIGNEKGQIVSKQIGQKTFIKDTIKKFGITVKNNSIIIKTYLQKKVNLDSEQVKTFDTTEKTFNYYISEKIDFENLKGNVFFDVVNNEISGIKSQYFRRLYLYNDICEIGFFPCTEDGQYIKSTTNESRSPKYLKVIIKSINDSEMSEQELNNIIKNSESFKYIASTTVNRIRQNQIEPLKTSLKNSAFLTVKGKIRTALPNEQKYKGSYGVRISLVFNKLGNENKDNENYVTKDYYFDINTFTGVPYAYTIASSQIAHFPIDGQNFIKVKRVELFVKDFPKQTQDVKPNDIFISELTIGGANLVDEEVLNGMSLSMTAPGGYTFLEKTSENSELSVYANFKVLGKVVNPTDPNLKFEWYKQDLQVVSSSQNYNKNAGVGWKILQTSPAADKKNVYTFIKKDILVQKVKFKCVAIYESNLLQKEFTINNPDANYAIEIVSSNGVNFALDSGQTELTCKVTSQSNINKSLLYRWTRVDINNFSTFLKEQKGEFHRNSTGKKDEQQYHFSTYSVSANTIFDMAVYKCQVKIIETNDIIGTAEIAITNKSNPNGGYNLVIENGNQLFKYSQNGLSPCHESLDAPITILPLSFKLYNPDGGLVEIEKINPENITWTIPITNTMLKDIESNASAATLDDRSYNKRTQFVFSIADSYNESKSNNEIGLNIFYQNRNITAKTSFTFLKQGDPGTNGTGTVIKIFACDKGNNIITEYPRIDYIYSSDSNKNILKDGNEKYIYKSYRNFENLSVKIWQNGQEISGSAKNILYTWEVYKSGKDCATNLKFTSTEVSTNEASLLSKYLELTSGTMIDFWEAYEKANDKVEGKTKKEIKENKEKNIVINNENCFSSIIKVSVSYKGKTYTSFIPIITTCAIIENYPYLKFEESPKSNVNKLTLKYNTGFRYVTYASDGTRPVYDNRTPFTFELEEGFVLDEYPYHIVGSIKQKDDNPILLKNYLLPDKIIKDKKEIYISPISSGFDNDCNSNALCVSGHGKILKNIYNEETKEVIMENNQVVQEEYDMNVYIHIPIFFSYNKYGYANINGWDGSSLDINEDDSSILAVQVGAGKKNSDNTFTGILMGSVKEGTNKPQTGLMGFSRGVRSIFLDAQNGNATFGVPGGGQIKIDAASGDGAIESGDYNTKDGTGMRINFSSGNGGPSIRFGSDNFYVTPDGFLRAKGGGNIAGWNILDNMLYKNKVGLSAKAEKNDDVAIWAGCYRPYQREFNSNDKFEPTIVDINNNYQQIKKGDNDTVKFRWARQVTHQYYYTYDKDGHKNYLFAVRTITKRKIHPRTGKIYRDYSNAFGEDIVKQVVENGEKYYTSKGCKQKAYRNLTERLWIYTQDGSKPLFSFDQKTQTFKNGKFLYLNAWLTDQIPNAKYTTSANQVKFESGVKWPSIDKTKQYDLLKSKQAQLERTTDTAPLPQQAPFSVTYDGQLRATSAIIGSGYDKILIGGGTGDSFISTQKHNNLYSTYEKGFYLGTEGMSFGPYGNGDFTFKVDKKGVLQASEGIIGKKANGWTIKERSLQHKTNGEIDANIGTNYILYGTADQSSGRKWADTLGITYKKDKQVEKGKYKSIYDYPFSVTSNGFLRARQGRIANWWIIDDALFTNDSKYGKPNTKKKEKSEESKIEDQIYEYKAQYLDNKGNIKLRATPKKLGKQYIVKLNPGIYLGKEGISCGELFSVNSKGELRSLYGEIGGWKITSDSIHTIGTTGGVTLNSNGSIEGPSWSISADGTARFAKFNNEINANKGYLNSSGMSASGYTGTVGGKSYTASGGELGSVMASTVDQILKTHGIELKSNGIYITDTIFVQNYEGSPAMIRGKTGKVTFDDDSYMVFSNGLLTNVKPSADGVIILEQDSIPKPGSYSSPSGGWNTHKNNAMPS